MGFLETVLIAYISQTNLLLVFLLTLYTTLSLLAAESSFWGMPFFNFYSPLTQRQWLVVGSIFSHPLHERCLFLLCSILYWNKLVRFLVPILDSFRGYLAPDVPTILILPRCRRNNTGSTDAIPRVLLHFTSWFANCWNRFGLDVPDNLPQFTRIGRYIPPVIIWTRSSRFALRRVASDILFLATFIGYRIRNDVGFGECGVTNVVVVYTRFSAVAVFSFRCIPLYSFTWWWKPILLHDLRLSSVYVDRSSQI